MTDTYNQLRKELRVYYPDVTDNELNEMTNILVNFYTTAVKTVLDKQKVYDVNDKNFINNGDTPNE